jgi:hypothetical protein
MSTVPLEIQRNNKAVAEGETTASGLKTTVAVAIAAVATSGLWVAFFFMVVVPVAKMLR